MDLSNLKPAEGSVHREKKRLGRGEGLGKEELQHVVIRELNHVQVIVKNGFEEVKCLFKEHRQSLVLKTLTEKSIKLLILT